MIQTITTAIIDALATLLSEDTNTLDAVARPEMILSQAPFTPDTAEDPSALVAPTFTGYAPLAAGAGTPIVLIDPPTQDRIIVIPDPVGGWRFQTENTLNLPQTIYGWGITDGTGAILYSSALFDTPIELTGDGQGFNVPYARVRLPLSAFIGQTQ